MFYSLLKTTSDEKSNFPIKAYLFFLRIVPKVEGTLLIESKKVKVRAARLFAHAGFSSGPQIDFNTLERVCCSFVARTLFLMENVAVMRA